MSTVRLAIVDDAAGRAAALALLAERAERFNTGALPIADRCAQADIFSVEESGVLVGYYAIEARKSEAGKIEGFILAAAGVPNIGALFVMRRIWPLIERQFIDAETVALATRRRAMVREAERQGYREAETLAAGVVMRKWLEAGNALRPL